MDFNHQGSEIIAVIVIIMGTITNSRKNLCEKCSAMYVDTSNNI